MDGGPRRLEFFGYADRAKDRREFTERVESRAREHSGECSLAHRGLQNTLRRGWYWGSQAFRESLLAMIERPKGDRNYRSSLLGKSNLPGLCLTWEKSDVIRSSSAELVLAQPQRSIVRSENHLF